jgi:hypothetical protein
VFVLEIFCVRIDENISPISNYIFDASFFISKKKTKNINFYNNSDPTYQYASSGFFWMILIKQNLILHLKLNITWLILL